MYKKLRSIEGGILGFNNVLVWDVVESKIGLLIIRERHPSVDLANKLASKGIVPNLITTPDRLAEFYLINSLEAAEQFIGDFRNAQENAWYIICVPGSGSNTMNTKAPVIIEGDTLRQVMSTYGSVLSPCTKPGE